jgi:hypothetical protein
MKQINACWLKRIKNLREMISELYALKNKRGELFFNIVDLTKELDGLGLLMDTMLSSKETLIEQFNLLKISWANEFIETIELFEE